MSDGTNENKDVAAPQSRRDFVRTSAQVAVTAPAVAVLLSATTKQAKALVANYISNKNASSLHILDDFTFGNDKEDIDSVSFGNFNPLNGKANQDDHV